jgi:hypothetical protein
MPEPIADRHGAQTLLFQPAPDPAREQQREDDPGSTEPDQIPALADSGALKLVCLTYPLDEGVESSQLCRLSPVFDGRILGEPGCSWRCSARTPASSVRWPR